MNGYASSALEETIGCDLNYCLGSRTTGLESNVDIPEEVGRFETETIVDSNPRRTSLENIISYKERVELVGNLQTDFVEVKKEVFYDREKESGSIADKLAIFLKNDRVHQKERGDYDQAQQIRLGIGNPRDFRIKEQQDFSFGKASEASFGHQNGNFESAGKKLGFEETSEFKQFEKQMIISLKDFNSFSFSKSKTILSERLKKCSLDHEKESFDQNGHSEKMNAVLNSTKVRKLQKKFRHRMVKRVPLSRLRYFLKTLRGETRSVFTFRPEENSCFSNLNPTDSETFSFSPHRNIFFEF